MSTNACCSNLSPASYANAPYTPSSSTNPSTDPKQLYVALLF
jgi:hypothetical protein